MSAFSSRYTDIGQQPGNVAVGHAVALGQIA